MITIHAVRASAIFAHDDVQELVREYAAECSLIAIGGISPQAAMYAKMEEIGLLSCFGAYDGERLVGFGTVLMTVLPHYGKKVATVESLFVAKSSRNSGAGLRLMEVVERFAKTSGCVAILYSTPARSSLEKMLSFMQEYMRTNTVFCRSLA